MKTRLCFLLLSAMMVLSFVSSARAAGAALAETRHVEVAGDRIGYRSIGRGPTLVLANRTRGTLDTWDPLFLDALAAHYTVVTFDFPGVGYSTGKLPADMTQAAEFIDRFATALKLERFIAAGWSWGGSAMQAYLLAHPQRVTHAVLLGSNPPGPMDFPFEPAFIERAFKPVNDLADEEVLFFEPESEFSRRAARASRERIYARPGVEKHIPSKPEEIQAYLSAAKSFHEDSEGRRAQLLKTRVPILVICGDHDISTQARNWLALVGQLANAQVLVYPETGHGPQHQYPELTAQYIAAFVEHARP